MKTTGGEMTQTLYMHMNKKKENYRSWIKTNQMWLKKKFKEFLQHSTEKLSQNTAQKDRNMENMKEKLNVLKIEQH
jgi:hypothetical protein